MLIHYLSSITGVGNEIYNTCYHVWIVFGKKSNDECIITLQCIIKEKYLPPYITYRKQSVCIMKETETYVSCIDIFEKRYNRWEKIQFNHTKKKLISNLICVI